MIKQHPIQLNLCPTKLANLPWDALNALAKTALDKGEAARLVRLKIANEDHQARHFTLTRWFLRHSLSRHFGEVAPQDWRFQLGPHGKPKIVGTTKRQQGPEQRQQEYEPRQQEFNLSHSQTLIAVATGFSPLGVDVEQLQRQNNTMKIAQRYFSELEISTLAKIPESQKALYFARLWTLKEAYAKCLGLSLFDVIKSAQFQFDAQGNIEFENGRLEKETSFQFFQTVINEDSCLSLCWQRPSRKSEATISVNLQNALDSSEPMTLNWSSSR